MNDERTAPTPERVVADLLSGDADRVWSASSAVAGTHDAALLDAVADAAGPIRAATDQLELGGGLFPNRSRLTHALRRAELHRSGRGCLCELNKDHPFHDPDAEAAAGWVVLGARRRAPSGNDLVEVTCAACGTAYEVEEGDYHYRWWEWRRI